MLEVDFIDPSRCWLLPVDGLFTGVERDSLDVLLREQGAFEKWSHIIDGIRNGFNVGIRGQITHTITHPKPLILESRFELHFVLHPISSLPLMREVSLSVNSPVVSMRSLIVSYSERNHVS